MGAMGSPAVQLLLELKNKMKTGFKAAKDGVRNDVNEMKAKLGELKSKTRETFEDMANQVPYFGDALKAIGNPYTLIIAGLTALIMLGGKAVTMATEWERSMAKVNVTAQMGRDELKGLSNEILSIAERNVLPLEEVPEAFNRIVSAGMDTRSALKMLEPTLQAAKAGFTDVETTAKAAVNVMASSGISDATKVYDILFATLNKGNAEFADIANYLPKIIPMARNAGISLEETAGAFAYLTAQGFKAEQASTGLMNVFKALSDSRTIYGSKITKGFKGIGVEIFEASGKMRSFMDILKDLKKSMGGLSDQQRVMKFDSIGLDTEASMTLSSMLQDYDKLHGIVDFTANSQGQLNEAIKNSSTSTDNWARTVNLVKGTMTEMGELALPKVNEMLGEGYDKLLQLKQATKEWNQETTWAGWLWDKVVLNIKNTVDTFSNAIEKNFSWLTKTIQHMSDMLENWKRFFSGGKFVPVSESRKTKADADTWASMWAENKQYFADPRLVDQARKENSLKNLTPDSAGSALNDLKHLHFAKQAFDNAMTELLPSKNRKAKDFLNQYGIKSNEDFYRLMQQGKMDEVVNKLPGLMPKSGKTNQAGTGGITMPTGVGNVTSAAQQSKTQIINIDSFIKGDVISQNSAIQGMSKEELIRFFQEMFRRMLGNSEMLTGQ